MSGFVKVKTRDLSGAALDWAVGKAEGILVADTTGLNRGMCKPYRYSPSADWSQGGPLIEKYMIGFGLYESSLLAIIGHNDFAGCEHGKTHLIAACRAIVSAKLGDEVDVPEGLV
jgi:hypothetical protein